MLTSPGSSNGADTGSDWQPSASLETLQHRARLLRETRAFFARRGLLEVETPQLSAAAATDPHLESLHVTAPAGGLSGWLHTSPEFPMKRLLAAGSGDIWQLARVFRGAESGRRHNPEFTLLEWYRVGWDAGALMDEVDAFVRELAGADCVVGASRRLSYREAFLQYAGFDPFAASLDEIRGAFAARNVAWPDSLGADREACLDLALAVLVEPGFDPAQPTFVHDFPASHAALAQIRPGDPPVAERFELFLGGMELANGFRELTDPDELARRFHADLGARRASDLVEPPLDERLLAAHVHGLPRCAGVALGFDRLAMILTGLAHIDEVLAFPWSRA